MLKKSFNILKSERAEATYISTVVYILITVICIMFVLSVFSIVSAKQKLDHTADQMTKQIQLAGGTNQNTTDLFNNLKSNISGSKNVRYNISSDYIRPTPSGMYSAIQLGTPFYITMRAEVTLAGFGDLIPIKITLQSKGAGVSECYWK